MEKTLKVFAILDGKAKAMVIKRDLHAYYDLLGCDLVDILQRKIGRKTYNFVIDEEGRLKDGNHLSAILDKPGYSEILVGNMFVAGNIAGNLTSLKDEQIEEIAKHVGTAKADIARPTEYETVKVHKGDAVLTYSIGPTL